MSTNIINNDLFDLDINNYTIDDLKSFLKMSNGYDILELTNTCDTLIKSISNNKINQQQNIIDFINKTKKILQSELEKENTKNIQSIITEKVTQSNLLQTNDGNPIGKILLPLSSSHQPLQTTSINTKNISGYGINTTTVSYVFNTQLRDKYFYTTPSNCTFTLPIRLENVMSIKLSALQIPNIMLAFSKIRGTNQLFIAEDFTGNNAIVTIPDGNYPANDFATILTNAINQEVLGGNPRFNVSVNPYTNKVTITNSTYTFTMNIIKKVPYYDCTNKEHYRLGIPDSEGADPKNSGVPPSLLFNSMGYYMGYRKIEYTGEKSYTSEGNYDTIFTDYIYFTLNDYNNCYVENTIGVLPNFLIKTNILGVVPITSNAFTVEFNNTQDNINRTRIYNSPVTISKISIQILNQYGEILDLNLNDYSFCIQIESVYNISQYSFQN